MTLRIRVALQGGGAKLVTLIAAADALADLAAEGKVEITRLAGTSAGSIVACMLATKRPMETYRTRTLAAAKELIHHFDTKPWKTAIAWRLYRGTPIYPEARVREFMRKVFPENERLTDLKIPTKIVVTNVRHRGKRVYDSAGTQDWITDIITTSSALPLAFRSFKQTDLAVDGGLVSNFPASELIADNPEQDSLMGFSFEYKPEAEPGNILEYLGALASTAIESNVKYNAERIREVGGRVCELPNQFSTLDFAEALRALEPDQYKHEKTLARAKIEETLARLTQQSKATKRAAGESVDMKMLRVYQTIRAEYPYKAIRASMLIIANCLKRVVDSTAMEADEIVQTVDYRPQVAGEALLAVRLGLASGGRMPLTNEKDDIRVIDSTGNELSVTSMIVEEDGQFYSILVLDRPLVLEQDQFLRVVHRTSQLALTDNLNEHKRMAIRSTCRQKEPIEAEDILIGIPESRGPAA